MKIPRKRTILAIHRWLGILAALFLLVLALTGLALNHTERLGLDSIMVRNGQILNRYGMLPDTNVQSFRIDESDTLNYIDGQLFHNLKSLGPGGKPVGIWSSELLQVVGTEDELFLMTGDGDLVEKMSLERFSGSSVSWLGQTPSGGPLLMTDSDLWKPDAEWVDFELYSGEYTKIHLEIIELPGELQKELTSQFQGAGVSLYRVLLDLHSGRLFGLAGRSVMDLTALAILLLVSSGIGGWIRRKTKY